MALQFILGGSGSGKSHCLYQKMIEEALAHPELRYLVLVPEQFTLQTQRDLVAMHPRHGILNIDVLSFQRLAYRVFEETGREIGTILEETGKNLMLRRVAQEEQENLTLLGSNLRRMGTISQMKSMISELTQYGITLEQLDVAILQSKGSPQLYYKLQDMRLLYQKFQDSLQGRYITAEQILDALSQVIDKSEQMKRSVVALDGFTGFTPVQNRLLQKMLILAQDVLVTVTLDDRENPDGPIQDHELFALSKKTIQGLKRLAREAGAGVKESLVVQQGHKSRFQGKGPLFWLEQQIFRYSSYPYQEAQRAVRLVEAKDPRMEVRWVAEEICRLVRKGFHYRQIGVVAGDLKAYSHYIEKIFLDYGIPVFLDYKRSVLQNPMVEFLRSFLEMAEQDFTYDTVFRYLRCGLAGLEPEDVDLLDNYVLALGIRGRKKWESRWMRLYGDLGEEELERINELRSQFWESSGQIAALLGKKSTVLEKTKRLYEVITGLKLQEQMKSRELYLENQGEASLLREYRQIYGIIIDLLDKLAELLGEEEISLTEYREILDAGFGEAKVGIVPPSLDQVMAGDVERTRLKDIRALFFLGVNEGNVPKTAHTPGVLSDLDRERLAGIGIELAPTPRQQAYTQRLYLYMNMTKPSHCLYVSWSQVGADGKGLQPSYLIGTIRKIFPDLQPEAGALVTWTQAEQQGKETEEGQGDEGKVLAKIHTQRQALECLKRGLTEYRQGEHSPEFLTLYRWFSGQKEWEKKLRQLLSGAFPKRRDSMLSRAVARALYGTVLENSVTRLEQFASCAYAHFLRYGLELRERELYEFEPVDMGNVFHRVMELFFQRMEGSAYTWAALPGEVRDAWADACLEQVITDYGNTVLQSTARNAYTIERMRRIIRRSVWALQEQLKLGSFTPGNVELSFSQVSELEAVNIRLSEEEKISLQGRVDRVDRCQEEKRVLVKIIDYKSGNTTFQLLSLYHGLQLQLVVYLGAVMELEQRQNPEKEVVPAGIFYYQLQDPILELEEGESEESRERRILESLRLSGLVNREDAVIRQLDGTMPGRSSILPLSYRKDGSLGAGSSVASQEQFQQAINYVNQKIRELGSRMLEGEISVNPYELGGRTACDFCTYRGICQMDARTDNGSLRRLEQLSGEEIWARIGQEKEE
ncbi:MAG: helicase-exonuclease AddAB subunit AddB [Lachnospiraceae bacterium]|nr:helicase-exonuclease AddAB subunit AddB [Lachnospiraceae bacterium]